MGIEQVKEHFRQFGREADILEFATSSATVQEAADTIGVIPARIAKTLSFRGHETDEHALLIVAAGDARIDNKKFRTTFTLKPRMLSPEDVLQQTGHAIGGVCPFGLAHPLKVYLDESLKRFDTVFPACGSSNSAIELTLPELERYAAMKGWVDVCKWG
ncbi:YbaK/EbsC family protein [Paenibacillus campi]|uniref:YbaK/EbsC family protein n=1 Tax=Paenibacillus campi TaxID=3106031 RepID=UPI002AFE5E82|nr:YbaK/EbsC family protein [Paenibacillus sp. SGZ-1009]